MSYGIKFEARGIVYDLNITGRVSVIEGDSGTGKTMFAGDLAMYAVYRNKFGKVAVYNYMNKFSEESATGKGKIIVIDNADIQLGKEEIKAINKDVGNQYIIFARGILAGLVVNLSDNYTMKYEGNRVTIEKVMRGA
jgi:archaellum biogenesis ATPase FlaH